MSLQGQASEIWSQTDTSSAGWAGEASGLLFTSPITAQEATWNQTLQRLIAIQNLKDNWDGEGAEAPYREIIDSVFELLLKHKGDLPQPSRIAPSLDGAIVVEWQLDGYYIEAEIETPFLAEWMQRSPQGEIIYWEENILRPDTVPEKYLLSDSNKTAA